MPQLPLKSQLQPQVLEELNSCPHCGSPKSLHLFNENEFEYRECESCSLIYLKTRLKIQHLNLIYDNVAYHDVSAGTYHTRNGLKRLMLLPSLPKGARIHEDGAGNGAFVYQALQHGFKATGSDFGKDAVNKARETYKVDLTQGGLEQQNIPKGSLDALASFNLICHLYEPWSYFAHVSSLLKPKGYFLLRIGDRTGYFKKFRQGHWSAPEHIYHFNSQLLKDMLAKQGLKVIWIKPAFDSDFPYFLYDYFRKNSGIKSRIAAYVSGFVVRFWNFLRLPKEDVFILAQKE